MEVLELREKQAYFLNRLNKIIAARKGSHQLRQSFTSFFTIDKIRNMDINDYVIGVKNPNEGFNFCYTIERKLDGLGRITGAPSHKFGLWYGHNGKKSKIDYYFVKRFGGNLSDAFKGIKNSLIDLISAGKDGDIPRIRNNKFSPMFKGKILSTYFPERYLNVFSDDHLDLFLSILNVRNLKPKSLDAVLKRELLLEFKNSDTVMKSWEVDLFAHFLYSEYRDLLDSHVITGASTDDVNINFPLVYNLELLNLEILPPNFSDKDCDISSAKKNYESELKKNIALGNRGEEIVFEFEVRRLESLGRYDLAKGVERVSLNSDTFGYDILSFESDGVERYIEVKATTSIDYRTNFFVTNNEINFAKRFENYFIYVVYAVTTNKPKLWVIHNPFQSMNENIVISPVNYNVRINTKEIV